MSFIYNRTVRLTDTDAGGVLYFAHLLQICHEAYEEALLEAGMAPGAIITDLGVALPIIHCSSDFLQPMTWGDRVQVCLSLRELRNRSFELAYEVELQSNESENSLLAATALTRHVCISAQTRDKQALPDSIAEALRSLS